MATTPVEIIFVDRRRLKSYVDQITASPLDREFVGKISGGLSLSGPKVGVELSQEFKERRVIDELRSLKAHLNENGLAQTGRSTTDRPRAHWVFESCEATKVSVPAAEHKEGKIPAFSFWWAPAPNGNDENGEFKPGPLCLLEDWRSESNRDDDDPVFFYGASTYTLMQSLVHYTRDILHDSRMGAFVPNDPPPHPQTQFSDDSHHPLSLGEYHNVKKLCYEFATDPRPLVESWGCLLSLPRQIHTLYRIREIGRDSTSNWNSVSTFGYPIWICDNR